MSDIKPAEQQSSSDDKDVTEQPQNVGGRPLKFETVIDLKQKIEQYFGECDPHIAKHKIFMNKVDGGQYLAEVEYITDRVPYGVEGLARALKTTRETLNKYESGDYDGKDDSDPTGERFSDAIKDAKARVKEDVERRMLTGMAPGASGIFWLKNNAGWVDQQQFDHTSKGKPMPLLGGATPLLDEDDAESKRESGDAAAA